MISKIFSCLLGVVLFQFTFVHNFSYADEIYVKETEPEKAEVEELAPWKKEISLGYNLSRGNTDTSQASMAFSAHRKTEDDEWTIKGDTYYSSTNKQMDTQKWSGLLRYALNFSKKEWFSFLKLETDHDKFANIDYRIIPSIGVGYWFSDIDDWKLMTEGSIGLEHTNSRDNTSDSDEMVGIIRTFLEKRVFEQTRISNDTTLYPSFGDFGVFRLHSETAITNPISDTLSLKFSLIDDYNSDAPSNTKKNDIRIISSLLYSF